MRELVGHDHQKDDHIGQDERLQPPEAEDVSPDLRSLCQRDPASQDEGGRGEGHEETRKERTRPGSQAVEDAFGVEGLEPVVEDAPPTGRAPVRYGGRPGADFLDQTQAPETLDEQLERTRVEGRAQLLLHILANLVEGTRAVQAAGDGVLRRPQAEEPRGGRILDDEDGLVLRRLPAHDEVVTEPEGLL